MRRALLALLLLTALVVPATAATPSSGKVSKASPKVTWNGSVTGFASWQAYNQGQGTCNNPSCDTFTLEVADGPAPLTLHVKSGDSTIYLEVVKPDGSKELFGGTSMDVKATIKNAPNGTYTLNIAQNEQTQGAHEGTAELVFPSAAPGPSATAAPVPTVAQPAPPTVTLKVGKISARKARKVLAKVTTSAPITAVKGVLMRGKKVVATGSLSKVDASASLSLKVKGKLKAGTHFLKLTATDTAGRPVSSSAKVRVAR